MSFAHLFGLLNNIVNIWKKVFKTFIPIHLICEPRSVWMNRKVNDSGVAGPCLADDEETDVLPEK